MVNMVDSKLLTDYSLKCKNPEKAYFDQRFECAAPKHWSKYTTTQHQIQAMHGPAGLSRISPNLTKLISKLFMLKKMPYNRTILFLVHNSVPSQEASCDIFYLPKPTVH